MLPTPFIELPWLLLEVSSSFSGKTNSPSSPGWLWSSSTVSYLTSPSCFPLEDAPNVSELFYGNIRGGWHTGSSHGRGRSDQEWILPPLHEEDWLSAGEAPMGNSCAAVGSMAHGGALKSTTDPRESPPVALGGSTVGRFTQGSIQPDMGFSPRTWRALGCPHGPS